MRDLPRLRRLYGKGYWRKMKGIARIRLRDGRVRVAELHWYEAHGIGKKEFKRKRYLDQGAEVGHGLPTVRRLRRQQWL